MTAITDLYGLFLPIEEHGNDIRLDVHAFLQQLIELAIVTKGQADRTIVSRGIYNYNLKNHILSCAPKNLQSGIENLLLPALARIVEQQANPSPQDSGILINYGRVLETEFKKYTVTPNFKNIPKQPHSLATFYMAPIENLFLSRVQTPMLGTTGEDTNPSDGWERQIREVVGWRALRDLLRHLGAEVKILETDPAILSTDYFMKAAAPCATIKYVRDRGLIIDNTAYLTGMDHLINASPGAEEAFAAYVALGDNFERRITNDGFHVMFTHHRAQGGDMVYDEINDVLFIGTDIGDESYHPLRPALDYIELATGQLDLRIKTGKTKVIAVPLIDSGKSGLGLSLVTGDNVFVDESVRGLFYHLDTMMAAVSGKIFI